MFFAENGLVWYFFTNDIFVQIFTVQKVVGEGGFGLFRGVCTFIFIVTVNGSKSLPTELAVG